MPHAFNNIWIHAILATKERLSLIEQGCPVRIINGIADHVHFLFLLSPKKAIAETIKQVKGATSHWVNEQEPVVEKFYWQQTGYAAYSVNESQLDKVFQYIKNQRQHHAKRTFQQEYDEIIKLYNIESN